MSDTILEIKDLHVLFPVHKKWLPAVDGVNLKIEKGEITGVVGESGSGKSVMSQTILRLRDHDTNVRYEGEILFEGEDLLKQPLNKIRDIRGDRISVIFQDPLTSLSPVHTVGSQLSEVLTLHKGLNKEQAKEKAIEMFKIAADMGLSCASRPSSPCLATRLPYGTPISFELLERVDAGEQWLKEQGFPIVRLRVHGDILRIEIEKERFSDFIAMADKITEKMKELGFVYITLDAEGFRSGSMDVHIVK